jgi:hypothetical protein
MMRPKPRNRLTPSGARPSGASGSILRGVFMLARGNKAGIAEFANTGDGLSASLAPLIAFPLVGGGIIAYSGQPRLAAIAVLSRVSGVLALPVITHAYAEFLGREHSWLRTATALNWSFWLLIPLLFVGAFGGAMLVTAGVPDLKAEETVIVLLGMYMLWLHWFTVRCGLGLSTAQAIGLVILSNLAIGLLTFGPDLADLVMKKTGGSFFS